MSDRPSEPAPAADPTLDAPTVGGPSPDAGVPEPPTRGLEPTHAQPPPAPVPPLLPVLPPPPVAAAAPAEPVAPTTGTADPGSRDSRGGLARVLVAALVGALVGALVSAGVYLAVGDSDGSSSAPASGVTFARPSDRIARRGDIASILRAAVPAVVAIVDDGGPDSGGAAGTGFVISPDGVIATNNHVVEGAQNIQVVFSDGTSRPATVLGRNAASDLAVIKVDASGLRTIALGDSNQVQVGDDVVAIGNALALQGSLTVTRGIISGLHREVGVADGGALEDVIQTDAAINPGNSGGPLVDAQGRVIGINTAIADPTSAQNVGFAIPISNAKVIIDQLRQGKQPAYLGVSTLDVDQARASGHDVVADAGAYVQSVAPGTPAAKAGVRAGDVIVSVDGRAIVGAPGLGGEIRKHRPGDSVMMGLDRDGKQVEVTVTLGEAPTS